MEIIPNLGESDYKSIIRERRACTLHTEHLRSPLDYVELGVSTSQGIGVYGHIIFSDRRIGHDLLESKSHLMEERISREMEENGYASMQTNALINYRFPLRCLEIEDRGKGGFSKSRYRLVFNPAYIQGSECKSAVKTARSFLRELYRTKFLPKRKNLHLFEGFEPSQELRMLDHAGTVDTSDAKRISIDFGGKWGYKRELMPEDQIILCLERDIEAVSKIYSVVMQFLAGQRGFEDAVEQAVSSVVLLEPDWSED